MAFWHPIPSPIALALAPYQNSSNGGFRQLLLAILRFGTPTGVITSEMTPRQQSITTVQACNHELVVALAPRNRSDASTLRALAPRQPHRFRRRGSPAHTDIASMWHPTIPDCPAQTSHLPEAQPPSTLFSLFILFSSHQGDAMSETLRCRIKI